MKYLLMVILLVSPMLWAADKPLNKAVVTSLYSLTEKMEVLEAKYPKVFTESEKFGITDQNKAIQFISSSKAYPEVKKLLSDSGFSSLEEFYDVSIRLMGGLFSVRMEKMPTGTNMKSMLQSLEQSIETMKKQNMPESLIASMEVSLKKNIARMQEMMIAAEKASAADKKFVSKNMDWIMAMVPDESQF